jgi:hypothetical protein
VIETAGAGLGSGTNGQIAPRRSPHAMTTRPDASRPYSPKGRLRIRA